MESALTPRDRNTTDTAESGPEFHALLGESAGDRSGLHQHLNEVRSWVEHVHERATATRNDTRRP